jgi:hypothetical protein
MSDPIAEFVSAGVTNYLDAVQAVAFFEAQVLDLLEQALRDGLAEGPVALSDAPGWRRLPGQGGGQSWIVVHATARVATGTSFATPRIQLGVWWNVRFDATVFPSIVYANLKDDGAPVASFEFAPTAAFARVRAYREAALTRLYVPVESPPALAADARLVLGALQSALSRPG